MQSQTGLSASWNPVQLRGALPAAISLLCRGHGPCCCRPELLRVPAPREPWAHQGASDHTAREVPPEMPQPLPLLPIALQYLLSNEYPTCTPPWSWLSPAHLTAVSHLLYFPTIPPSGEACSALLLGCRWLPNLCTSFLLPRARMLGFSRPSWPELQRGLLCQT